MRNYLKILILLVLTSCTNTSSTRNMDELPDSSLINEVISVVIKTDSLWKSCEVNKNFKVQKLYKKIKWENNSVPPPPPPSGPFSISYDELFKFFNSEKNSSLRLKDSLYITQQLNSTETFFISDSNALYFSKKDDSYYQFYLPVFSSDKKVVYVFYALECGPLCGSFYEILLKRMDNKWIKVYGDLCGER